MGGVLLLTQRPGSSAVISDDTGQTELTASYLSDALGDLLRTVRAMSHGALEAHCSWQEEPGEFRWNFARRGETVEIQILWFDDSFTSTEGSEGQLRWSTRQTLSAVGGAIVDGATRALAEYGEEGYLEEWAANPFPRDVLEDLRNWRNGE